MLFKGFIKYEPCENLVDYNFIRILMASNSENILIDHVIDYNTIPELNLHNTLPYAEATQYKRVMAFSSAAAFISAGCTSALYNPMDCLRVRWQLLPRNDPALRAGFLRYGTNIIREEGLVRGLWRPGLAYNSAGMAISASIRFGCYETLRDYLNNANNIRNDANESCHKSTSQMLIAGVCCGALGYSISTPFHLLKTINQAESAHQGFLLTTGNETTLRSLFKQGGILSLWRGTFPLGCRGALFTSGQMLGYDGMKTFGKKNFDLEDNFVLRLFSGASASLGASALSAPADLIMTKYMANPNYSYTNLARIMEEIVSKDGVLGFWRGWHISFARLTPVMITYSTLYEEVRFQFGIGYLS